MNVIESCLEGVLDSALWASLGQKEEVINGGKGIAALRAAPGWPYRSEAEYCRQCVSLGGKAGDQRQPQGQHAVGRAASMLEAQEHRESGRIKCRLREARKQHKLTADLAPELTSATAPLSSITYTVALVPALLSF